MMPVNLTQDAALNRFLGKKCLIVSSNGQIKVGKCMGLSTMGTKDFFNFITTSGNDMAVNVSYLESVEVVGEDQITDDNRGQVGGVAFVRA
jgi:hypothetical protein